MILSFVLGRWDWGICGKTKMEDYETEEKKQAAADVLFNYSKFVLACIGNQVRPCDMRLHLMKEVSGLPTSLKREPPSSHVAISCDLMGSSSSGTAKLDKSDSFQGEKRFISLYNQHLSLQLSSLIQTKMMKNATAPRIQLLLLQESSEQMLRDLEFDRMNKTLYQKLYYAFLSSSSLWQTQPVAIHSFRKTEMNHFVVRRT